MVTVAFRDPAGRPLVDAVVSIAAAPGEVLDIGMITNEIGEISFTPTGFGAYEFVVVEAGSAHSVVVPISAGTERVTAEVS